MRQFAWQILAALSCSAGLLTLGCQSETKTVDPAAATDPHDHDHGHDHAAAGPHGGQLIELGEEEFHAELAHDDKSNVVTLYVLDGAAKLATPIEAKELTIELSIEGKPLKVALPAKPMEGEADGKSSRFEVENLELFLAIEAPKVTGQVTIPIAGKDYVGKIEAHAHDDHGHAHK